MENFLSPATVADLNRIEWNGQPVLSTSQLAFKFETTEKNLSANFNRNEDRFVEGKHYFKLEGNELENLRSTESGLQISPMTRVLYLWTKRGVARHAKMLSTDVAWEVYELLEDTYFNQRGEKETPTVSDFERGKELAKLAPFEKDAFTQTKIIAKAANLILGYDFLDVPAKPQQLSLFYN